LRLSMKLSGLARWGDAADGLAPHTSTASP